MKEALYWKTLWEPRATGTEANTKWGGTLALCCRITPSWCFYCLVSSEKTLPSVASAADRGTNLLRACLGDADVPLMVCATGMVFKASTGLLKSVSSPLWIVCCDWEHQGDMAWSGAASMTKHSTLHPHTVLCLARMEMHGLTWKNCILPSASLAQTPADLGHRNALERVCECLISFLCQWITFLAPVLMHAM